MAHELINMHRISLYLSDMMAKFTINDTEYDSDDLDNAQKRVISLYQKALKDEAESIASLEVARAARVEIGRKLQELVIDKVKN